MSALLRGRRVARDGSCGFHGFYPSEHDGCMKCGSGEVAQVGVGPVRGERVPPGASSSAMWLDAQADVLEQAAVSDPAAVEAARYAAQARAMAALYRRTDEPVDLVDADVDERVSTAGRAVVDDVDEWGWS